MSTQSIRKLAGQAIVAGFPAGEPPEEMLALARRGELGGFILFKRNLGALAEVAELVRRLGQAFPKEQPPWLAVDQEGGRVQRLKAPVLQLPPMRKLGQLDDPALTEVAGLTLGRQLAALGFTIDFAPSLDVDSFAESPVIGDRSFSAEPSQVARHGLAFARGLTRGGVAACGKHFPGHGATTVDSHLELPRLDFDRARLDAIELAPFRALKDAPELTAMMSAHIVVGALDAERPATLSKAVLQGLLRGELGYRGPIFSDDLEMKAIASNYGVSDAACDAIAAGCDAVLICATPQLCFETHEALIRRAEGDPEFEARLADARDRCLAVRHRFTSAPLQGAALDAELARSSEIETRIAHALERLASVG